MKTKNKADEYDCASCQGKYRRCYYYDKTIERNNEYKRGESRFGKNVSELFILLEFGICPKPFFTSQSILYYKLYNIVGGLGNIDYSKLSDIPAYYYQAVEIILNAEEEAINLWPMKI